MQIYGITVSISSLRPAVRDYRWNRQACRRHAGTALTTSTVLRVVPDVDGRRLASRRGVYRAIVAAAAVGADDADVDDVDDDDGDEFDGYDSRRPDLGRPRSAVRPREAAVLVTAQRSTNCVSYQHHHHQHHPDELVALHVATKNIINSTARVARPRGAPVPRPLGSVIATDLY